MDETTGPFRPEPAPTAWGWLQRRAARAGWPLTAGPRSWLPVLVLAATLGVAGGLAIVTLSRPAGEATAAGLPQAVRVVVTTVPTTTAPAMVHVAGAVASPGVYPLAEGARVADVVRQAGGPGAGADLARLNLAEAVSDGSRVYVPAVGETPPPALTSRGGAGSSAPGVDGPPTPAEPVDLNQATEAELDRLPGIGPATAAAIVAFRDEHGPFASVEALEDVPGIGPAKVAALRDLARV